MLGHPSANWPVPAAAAAAVLHICLQAPKQKYIPSLTIISDWTDQLLQLHKDARQSVLKKRLSK